MCKREDFHNLVIQNYGNVFLKLGITNRVNENILFSFYFLKKLIIEIYSFLHWSLIYHFDHLCLNQHQTNSYAIKSSKEKAAEVAENKDLGQTESNKMNLALENKNLYNEEQIS